MLFELFVRDRKGREKGRRKAMVLAKRFILGLIVITVAYVLLTIAASELGGEVVTLLRPNQDASISETRVWIIDEDTHAIIEHGEAGDGWLAVLERSPEIEIRRGGQIFRYTASLAPQQHDRYHKLRREKYGVADQIIEWLSMTPASDCAGLPVVLKPLL